MTGRTTSYVIWGKRSEPQVPLSFHNKLQHVFLEARLPWTRTSPVMCHIPLEAYASETSGTGF